MNERKPRRMGLNPERGLKALIADTGGYDSPKLPQEAQKIPIDRLQPNPGQPRKSFDQEELDELVSSLREKGIIQPLIVRPDPAKADMYQIVAGERRWRAAQVAQLHEIPVLVRDYNDIQALEIGIIENVQRAELNPIEEATGYRRLISEFGHTQEMVADALGKSRSHIANLLRLLGLPSFVKDLVRKGGLSAGHARALVTASDPEALAKTVVRRGLSVRQTEDLVRKAGKEPPATASVAKDPDTVVLESDLSAALKMKVAISHRTGGESGKITVSYRTLEGLDRLCGLLSAVR